METKINQLKEKLDKLQSEYDGQMGEDNEKVESEFKQNYILKFKHFLKTL